MFDQKDGHCCASVAYRRWSPLLHCFRIRVCRTYDTRGTCIACTVRVTVGICPVTGTLPLTNNNNAVVHTVPAIITDKVSITDNITFNGRDGSRH